MWLSTEGAIVQAAARPAGSDWQRPGTLLSAPSQQTPNAQTAIAVDTHGNAVAIWDHNRGVQRFVVQSAVYGAP